MTNFNEEVRKILIFLWDRGFCQSSRDESVDQAISAITELVKGIVPGEKNNICEFDPRVDIGEVNKAERKGFNSCRSEILKRLG